jgi:hypothetical protein
MRDFVIWAVPRADKKFRIGASSAHKSPLPFGAEVVTRVSEADLNMMMLWAKRQAKRGWSAEKMRATCEG